MIARLRLLSVLALIGAAGPFLWVLQDFRQGLVLALCLVVPLVVPPGVLLLRLRQADPPTPLGSAAPFATLGVYAPILSVVGVSARPSLWGGLALWTSSFVFLTAIHWLLFWTIGRAVRAGWPLERRAWPSVMLAAGCLLTGSLFYGSSLGEWAREAANEASARGSLRTITGLLAAHTDRGRCAFPLSLDALSSPNESDPQTADLLVRFKDGAAFKKSNYTFQYLPGPPVTHVPVGCSPGAQTYVLTARPITWNVSGRSSFYADNGGDIRYTTEARPATGSDRIVPR